MNMDFLAGFWCATVLSLVAAYLSGMWRAWRADRRARLRASSRAVNAFATRDGLRLPVLSIADDWITVVGEDGVGVSWHVSECDEIEWTLGNGRVETLRPKQ